MSSVITYSRNINLATKWRKIFATSVGLYDLPFGITYVVLTKLNSRRIFQNNDLSSKCVLQRPDNCDKAKYSVHLMRYLICS